MRAFRVRHADAWTDTDDRGQYRLWPDGNRTVLLAVRRGEEFEGICEQYYRAQTANLVSEGAGRSGAVQAVTTFGRR
jgi:hypothetical protein